MLAASVVANGLIQDCDRPRRMLGLCSGTSADGVDMAAIEISGAGNRRKVRFLGGEIVRMPEELQKRVRNFEQARGFEMAALDRSLGEWFGNCAKEFLKKQFEDWQESFWAVGSHGQTVFHHDGDPAAGSLQLGDPTLVAAALGLPVVGDFRASDLAAGGEGAPVSPFADWVLFGAAPRPRAVLNLGGIANITVLPGVGRLPSAWDCGPANGPLDALCRLHGAGPYDQNGRLSQEGRVLPDLLHELQKDPFFARDLPRSTGLERFGTTFACRMRELAPQAGLASLLHTAAELASWAVADSLRRSGWAGGELAVCGGGAQNPTLVAALRQNLGSHTSLEPYSTWGWDPDLREAVAFALLADAFCCREPAVWPMTTGAAAPAVLGKWCLPPFLDRD